MSFKIVASACYLPHTIRTAEDLDQQLQLPPGTCRQRYGVEYRHYAAPEESALYMGAEAAKTALQHAQLSLTDMDLLLCASGTSHQALPYNAAGMLYQLQSTSPLPGLDINASCLSFLAALQFAEDSLVAGRYRRIIIISSEVATVGTTQGQAEITTLFADGAAAFILEATSASSGLIASQIQTYPEGFPLCQIRAGGSGLHPSRNPQAQCTEGCYFEMQGKALYRLVSRLAPKFIQQGLINAGQTLTQMDYIVPHQASPAGLAHLIHQLHFDPQRVINLTATMGNQIAASIPIALHHLLVNQQPQPGQQILLFGSSAGLSLGMGVLRL